MENSIFDMKYPVVVNAIYLYFQAGKTLKRMIDHDTFVFTVYHVSIYNCFTPFSLFIDILSKL